MKEYNTIHRNRGTNMFYSKESDTPGSRKMHTDIISYGVVDLHVLTPSINTVKSNLHSRRRIKLPPFSWEGVHTSHGWKKQLVMCCNEWFRSKWGWIFKGWCLIVVLENITRGRRGSNWFHLMWWSHTVAQLHHFLMPFFITSTCFLCFI